MKFVTNLICQFLPHVAYVTTLPFQDKTSKFDTYCMVIATKLST